MIKLIVNLIIGFALVLLLPVLILALLGVLG